MERKILPTVLSFAICFRLGGLVLRLLGSLVGLLIFRCEKDAKVPPNESLTEEVIHSLGYVVVVVVQSVLYLSIRSVEVCSKSLAYFVGTSTQLF